MSITKRLFESKTMPSEWRRVVVSPSRALDRGGTARASCPGCKWSIESTEEEKIPLNCPRCGSRLTS